MPTFLPKKRGSLNTRIFIPKVLRNYFGERIEVWRSLRTDDHDEALYRSSKWKLQGKQLFRTLIRHGKYMTKDEIKALVSNWLESELDYAEDCRAFAGPLSDERREENLAGLDIMFEQGFRALLGNDYRKIETEADALIQAVGFPPMDRESADFGRLCRRLLRAKVE